MNCNPAPEVNCGETLPETCVIIVDNTIFKGCPAWLNLNINPNGCYRQSDFNRIFANSLCSIFTTLGRPGTCEAEVYTAGEGLLGSLYLGCIEDCDGVQIPLAVRDAIIDLYGEVCDLKKGLDISIGDIDPKCLQDPCGTPITTLGPLLQALIDDACDTVHTVGIYRAILTSDPAGLANPTVVVFENSIKFANVILPIVWTRTGAGVFTGTVTQPVFNSPKVYMTVGQSVAGTLASVYKTGTTTIEISTVGNDSGLVESSLEIRIYP